MYNFFSFACLLAINGSSFVLLVPQVFAAIRTSRRPRSQAAYLRGKNSKVGWDYYPNNIKY